MQTTQENNAQPTDDVAGRIAHVSLLIREAMCAATPASPEQFLTLTVPGKFEPVNLMVSEFVPRMPFVEYSYLSLLGIGRWF